MNIEFTFLKKIVAGFFCFFFVSFWSQSNNEKFDFVGIKDGISNVGIFSINQDQNKFIWLSTNGAGLYKYDGIDYVNYKHILNDSTSLSSSLVYCSFLDSKNRLWVGTEEGLNLYNRELDQFKRVLLVNKNDRKKSVSVRSIGEDKKGNLFIGTYDLGLFKLQLDSFKIEAIQNIDSNSSSDLSIVNIAVSQDGQVFFASDEGLKVYDYKINAIRNGLYKTKDGTEIIKDPVRTLLFDALDNLWVGTYTNGLFRISKDNEAKEGFWEIEHFLISVNTILSMASLKDQTILCGTENDGLFHLNSEGEIINIYVSNKEDEKSILSNSIWSLFVDQNQRIWMGYYNMGVAVYDELFDKFNSIESLISNVNSLQTGSVYGIVQDGEKNLWVCMDGGGVDIIDLNLNKFTHINRENSSGYKGLTSDYLQTLFIDSKENLWIGSWDKGIYLLEKGSKKFINFNTENTQNRLKSNSVMSFAEDSKGIIWIGSFYKGIHSFNPGNKQFTHHNSQPFLREQITNSDIRKVLVDSNDDLWIGTTYEGLLKVVILADNTYSVISMADRMANEVNMHTSSNDILSLYESADKNLWIGTRGAGLYKYDLTKDEFSWFNKTNGLNEENICSIIESSLGELWLGGNSGITKMNIEQKTFSSFNKSDGLLSNDFNMNAVYKGPKGNLYFGNYLGVDYFDPSKIKMNKVTPSLYFTDLKIFNEKVIPNQENAPLTKVISESNKIALEYEQSVFTIEYAGINYTRSEKNQYAYFLEGYEQDWNYVGNVQSATYTNLNPGTYIFKVKAANNDGLWDENFISLEVTILPPWWKTYWALILYISLFLFGILLLNKMTKNRLNEKQEVLNEREKVVQIQELNENKLRFFTNISHEFRTPLTLILNPLEDIMRSNDFNLPKEVKDKHLTIHKNADRLSRLIKELMDFRKLELNKVVVKARKTNVNSFVEDIVSYFNSEASIRNIYLNIESNDENDEVWVDQSMLEKIVFNILSNAFKVTPDAGVITICISLKNRLEILPLIDKNKPVKVFEISIKDTGEGLEKEELEKIFERFYHVGKLNSSHYGGTGIGLEVVQSFVALQKGKIEVKSTVNVGTIFRVILPLGNDHFSPKEIELDAPQVLKKIKFVRPEKEQTIKEDVESEIDKSNLLTLLIVEDNVELLNYLKLEMAGQYKVITATNGKKGLDLAQKVIPDVIITDVIMPEMNGFDFCIQIKNDLRFSHIPILMLTTKTMTDDWVEGIESGADAYLSKPFNMRILKSRLLQLTTNRQVLFNKYFSAISDSENSKNTNSLDKEFIQKVLNYIDDNLNDPELTVESLASQLNLSRSQFYRKIKTLTGNTANEFLRKIRLQRAKLYLEKGNSNVSEVCYEVGFATPSYFTKCFKKEFGILPTEIKPNTSI